MSCSRPNVMFEGMDGTPVEHSRKYATEPNYCDRIMVHIPDNYLTDTSNLYCSAEAQVVGLIAMSENDPVYKLVRIYNDSQERTLNILCITWNLKKMYTYHLTGTHEFLQHDWEDILRSLATSVDQRPDCVFFSLQNAQDTNSHNINDKYMSTRIFNEFQSLVHTIFLETSDFALPSERHIQYSDSIATMYMSCTRNDQRIHDFLHGSTKCMQRTVDPPLSKKTYHGYIQQQNVFQKMAKSAKKLAMRHMPCEKSFTLITIQSMYGDKITFIGMSLPDGANETTLLSELKQVHNLESDVYILAGNTCPYQLSPTFTESSGFVESEITFDPTSGRQPYTSSQRSFISSDEWERSKTKTSGYFSGDRSHLSIHTFEEHSKRKIHPRPTPFLKKKK